MLVVNGPVSADGYDWYEVRADNDLFGWVAAGKDGEDWIAPAAANCTDDLDESALWTVDPIDFFVCYGDTPVHVNMRWSSLEDDIDVDSVPACPYTGDNVNCAARPNWLFEPGLQVRDAWRTRWLHRGRARVGPRPHEGRA